MPGWRRSLLISWWAPRYLDLFFHFPKYGRASATCALQRWSPLKTSAVSFKISFVIFITKCHMSVLTGSSLSIHLRVIAVGVLVQVPYLVVGLAEPKISADGRKELYEWTAKQVPTAGAGATEVAVLVKPCATALQVSRLASADCFDKVGFRFGVRSPTLAACCKKGCANSCGSAGQQILPKLSAMSQR